MKSVAAADATEQFADLLEEVSHGRSVQITSGGKAVARLIPEPEEDLASREAAKRAYIEELRKRPALNLGPISRDDAYEDGVP